MLSMTKKTKTQSPITVPVAKYGSKEYENEFFSIFLIYSEKTTDQQAKQYILQYVKTKNKNTQEYSSLQAKKYTPYGVYVKMHMDGIKLPIVEQKSLDQFIQDLEKLNKDKLTKKEQTRKEKDIKDSRQIRNFLGDLNLLIDTQLDMIISNIKPNSDISGILKAYNLTITSHQSTKDLLNRMILDVNLAKTKKDEQLVEGYSYMTPKQLTVYVTFLENILSKINTISVVVRKPRKLKPKKPEQLVKKLHIQDECGVLGILSVTKTDIIGANILYTYNTKTRFLTQYLSDSGFSVKGTSLLNVKTGLKKKVRKPELLFAQINPKNRKFMESLWSSIKGKESTSKIRLSKVCVILSAFTI